MQAAKKPKNEELRLNLLNRLGILDSKAEGVYDDLTRIASFMCNTPISLVSLVDENRQWFKSKVGLDADETPRDFAFCAHAILGSDIFEIPDSHIDARFGDNPLVTGGPKVRFYADFIAKVNHELRTPLTSIQGSIALLSSMQSNAKGTNSELISIAMRNSQQLMKLVDEILDIQKLQSGDQFLNKQIFPIRDLSSRTYELTHQYVVDHNCKLYIEDNNTNLSIDADEGRLLQVITNLVSNAAKFSNENGHVEVDISTQGPVLTVKVTDYGIGIPLEKQHLLFKKFCQLGQKETKIKGTGLGLCIAKEIIEQHGGSVFVESVPNSKTTFGFKISGVSG